MNSTGNNDGNNDQNAPLSELLGFLAYERWWGIDELADRYGADTLQTAVSEGRVTLEEREMPGGSTLLTGVYRSKMEAEAMRHMEQGTDF